MWKVWLFGQKVETYRFLAVPESCLCGYWIWQLSLCLWGLLWQQHQNEGDRDLQRWGFCLEETSLFAAWRIRGSSGDEKAGCWDISADIWRKEQPREIEQGLLVQRRPLDNNRLQSHEVRSFLPQGQTYRKQHLPHRWRLWKHRGILPTSAKNRFAPLGVLLVVLHDEVVKLIQPIPIEHQTIPPKTQRYS